MDRLKKFLHWYVVYIDFVKRLKKLKDLGKASKMFVSKNKSFYRGFHNKKLFIDFIGHGSAILSTSYSLEGAENFTNFGKGVVIKIEPIEDWAAIDISPISNLEESEVIFADGCQYKITEILFK